jgi:hypothetical protein
LSLLAFYAWWGARLDRPDRATTAFLVAAAGVVCDLFAESLFIGWLPDDLAAVQRAGSLLTGAAANGLYTLAGVLLTLATPGLRGALLAWTWAIWASGAALTLTTLAGSVPGMISSSAALMVLFCPWVVVIGRRLR